MEDGFKYDHMQGAYLQRIDEVLLIQRLNERQVAAFIGGKCVATFGSRDAAKAFAKERDQ